MLTLTVPLSDPVRSRKHVLVFREELIWRRPVLIKEKLSGFSEGHLH